MFDAELSREEKDRIDDQIGQLIIDKGVTAAYNLIPVPLMKRWRTLFGNELQAVIEYSFLKLPQVVRVNTLKMKIIEFKKVANNYNWKLKQIKGVPYAFTIKRANNLSLEETPEYQTGQLYKQQLSSMFPVIALDPQHGEKILDIGAAPGSKTTQLAQLMKDAGEIFAIDISSERMKILQNAILRMGLKSIKPTVLDGTKLTFKNRFDRVLVDAPCSSEGIIRYKYHKLMEWDQGLSKRLSQTQFKLLEAGFRALKLKGTLIYATCTYSPDENEQVVNRLLQKYPSADILPVKIKGFKLRSGFERFENQAYDKRLVKSIRIYPHDLNSTGFFICKLTKISN